VASVLNTIITELSVLGIVVETKFNKEVTQIINDLKNAIEKKQYEISDKKRHELQILNLI
jgi:hypothetical protein